MQTGEMWRGKAKPREGFQQVRAMDEGSMGVQMYSVLPFHASQAEGFADGLGSVMNLQQCNKT